MEFLFVGTCRGGTAYVSKVLQSCGLNAGHESVFTRSPVEVGGPNWEYYDADVSWLAYSDIMTNDYGLKIVRVVRDPMAVIRSIINLRLHTEAGFWNWVEMSTGNWFKWKLPQDRVAQYYLDWHAGIQERAYEWIRVEDGPEPIALAVDRWDDDLYDDRTCNHRVGYNQSVEWESIALPLRGELCGFAESHGYDVPS